jgi:hypothetical protein
VIPSTVNECGFSIFGSKNVIETGRRPAVRAGGHWHLRDVGGSTLFARQPGS